MSFDSKYYTDGTVTLENGSATVVGNGTAWTFFGVLAGKLQVPGFPDIPILSVTNDALLTLAWPWPHANQTASDYAIALMTADQVTGLQTNWLYSQILARDVGFAFDCEASGSLGERAAYDAEAEGFRFGIFDDPENPVFYRKMSDTNADWGGPFKWRGPTGTTGASGVGDFYDILVDASGKPGTAEILLKHIFARAVSFPTNLSTSRVGDPDVLPTATAVISFRKNGVQFGTLTILTGGSKNLVVTATAFAAGDVLTVVAPSPRDDTLSGIYMTIAGTRV